MAELKKYIDYVLDNYLLPENFEFSSDKEYYRAIVNKLPEELGKLFDNQKYKIYGSCGKGAKSKSPFVAITNRSLTTSVQNGIYVDYIFKSDMSGFYLTIDQGVTSIKEKYGNKKGLEYAQKCAKYFSSQIDDIGDFEVGLLRGNIKGDSLEEGYEFTRVISKYYEKGKFSNDELIDDLQKIMLIYDNLVSSIGDLSYDDFINSIINLNNDIQYWTYTPGDNAEMWSYCVDNNIMVIDRPELGDLSSYSNDEERFAAIRKAYNTDGWPVHIKCEIDDFANNVKANDIIIAKKGKSKLLGYGIVQDNEYRYDVSRDNYKNIRNVKWIVSGEWDIPKELYVAVKYLTNITPYKGFADKLLAIIGGKEIMNDKSITEWFVPADPKSYDHKGAFKRNGFIDWSQSVNYNVGDIVYICYGKPLEEVRDVAIVEKVNMTKSDTVDDSDFIIKLDRSSKDRFARFKRIKELESGVLTRDDLRKHGLKNIQSANTLSGDLLDYIHSVVNNVSVNNGYNVIYYGGPGCGKSYFVKNNFCKDEGTFIRTTFYPDYTNSDFVGQLIPKYEKETGKLIYDIQPGPFTEALKLAYENKGSKIYLIIEEINRGNAAAIFGDIFQLLDRKDSGESEFNISNYIVEKYISDELNIDLKNKVVIPSNLAIIATMNTSDQNVYTLDSAFKRRWKMKYISNKFGLIKDSSDYDLKLGSMIVPIKNLSINWMDFISIINKAIIEEDVFGINSEDKQIGKYFVGSSDLITTDIYETNNFDDAAKNFAEKVLMYIWEDVSKLRRTDWFRDDIKTFESLLDEYISSGVNVFSANIKSRLSSDFDEGKEEETI